VSVNDSAVGRQNALQNSQPCYRQTTEHTSEQSDVSVLVWFVTFSHAYFFIFSSGSWIQMHENSTLLIYVVNDTDVWVFMSK